MDAAPAIEAASLVSLFINWGVGLIGVIAGMGGLIGFFQRRERETRADYTKMIDGLRAEIREDQKLTRESIRTLHKKTEDLRVTVAGVTAWRGPNGDG